MSSMFVCAERISLADARKTANRHLRLKPRDPRKHGGTTHPGTTHPPWHPGTLAPWHLPLTATEPVLRYPRAVGCRRDDRIVRNVVPRGGDRRSVSPRLVRSRHPPCDR